ARQHSRPAAKDWPRARTRSPRHISTLRRVRTRGSLHLQPTKPTREIRQTPGSSRKTRPIAVAAIPRLQERGREETNSNENDRSLCRQVSKEHVAQRAFRR